MLLLQYHALSTIIRCGQWNALRHGHFAYYSTTALTAMLAAAGFSPRTAWQFDLYGGTVLLAATRDIDGDSEPDDMVRSLLADDARAGVRDRSSFARLQRGVRRLMLRPSTTGWRPSDRQGPQFSAMVPHPVRSPSCARRGSTALPAVIDASPAKQGLRMPGTDIPVVAPAELAIRRPDAVLLFVPDLLAEVRAHSRKSKPRAAGG